MEYFLIKDNGECRPVPTANKQAKVKGRKPNEPVDPSSVEKYNETSFRIKGYIYKVVYENKKPTEEEFRNKSSGLLDGKGGYIKK